MRCFTVAVRSNSAWGGGLVVLGSGSQSLRFRPPLIVTPAHIDEGVGMIRKALGGMKA
jgi:4-aminobutyrate aminotransferase-like enzyme